MQVHDQHTLRPRRLSLPSSFSPSNRRRSRRSLQPSGPPPLAVDKQLPPIPFAHPPYMPMYHQASTPSPRRLHKQPPSPRPAAEGQEEDLWISSDPVASSSRQFAPSSPKPGQPTTPVRESGRFRRRLGRWTGGGSRELDFGCAGEWSDGPADMGDRFYSHYPGGVNRASTSSSVDVPSLTHSRGHSTSSSYSVSTAASSVPPSPTFGCHPDEPPPPLPLHTSRVPLTPRTAQWKRQSDEDAAVDALNEYFTRVRLSQIKEDVSPRSSVGGRTVRGSFSASPAGPPTFETDEPVPTPPSGLAIFGTSPDRELGFQPSLRPPSKQSLHSRSISHDLEIEFIETGHTTYVPLSVDPDTHSFPPSAFILPDDAFVFPAPPAHFESSPSAVSTFGASDSTESCETATTTGTGLTAGSSSTSTTVLRHRSPVPEHDIGPTLDELSHYFGASDLSSSSTTASASPSPPPSFRIHHQHHSSLPPLLPPAPISPLRKHSARFRNRSVPSSPRLGNDSCSTKRKSGSFVAAHRAKMLSTGQALPAPTERRVMYDWI
ncbi:hypothetical protein JCM8097_005678 [Rhodosporidiobolus ruineniae]